MDVYAELAKLQAKIGSGTASPETIKAFLDTYGGKLDSVGLGGITEQLGAAYDRLVKSGAGQEAPKSETMAGVSGFFSGLTTGVKNVAGTFAAPFEPDKPGEIPKRYIVITVLGLIAAILFLKK